MNPFRILIEPDPRRDEAMYREAFGELYDDPAVELSFLPELERTTLDPDHLMGAHAFVSRKHSVTRETLAGVDDLRIIARSGAGYDNVDLDACTERGIVVTHAPQGPTAAVAEQTLGLLILCARRFDRYERWLAEEGFAAGRSRLFAHELSERTIGLVGLGRIGRRVRELVRPLGPDVIAADPYADEGDAADLGVELVGLDELLETADFVTVHVPLTDETAGMLGEDEFRRMKESAYLINTSRGGIYPDADLARAIREGWIAGAAVDVFEDEPNVDGNPLLDVDECFTFPHVAGTTYESLTRISRLVADSIRRVRDGDLPNNILNPAAYDRPVPAANRSPSYRGD